MVQHTINTAGLIQIHTSTVCKGCERGSLLLRRNLRGEMNSNDQGLYTHLNSERDQGRRCGHTHTRGCTRTLSFTPFSHAPAYVPVYYYLYTRQGKLCLTGSVKWLMVDVLLYGINDFLLFVFFHCVQLHMIGPFLRVVARVSVITWLKMPYFLPLHTSL